MLVCWSSLGVASPWARAYEGKSGEEWTHGGWDGGHSWGAGVLVKSGVGRGTGARDRSCG